MTVSLDDPITIHLSVDIWMAIDGSLEVTCQPVVVGGGRDELEGAVRGVIRAGTVVEVEQDQPSATTLVITEVPAQLNRDDILGSIADRQVHEGEFTSIHAMDDRSSERTGTRIVLRLGRDADADNVLGDLLRHLAGIVLHARETAVRIRETARAQLGPVDESSPRDQILAVRLTRAQWQFVWAEVERRLPVGDQSGGDDSAGLGRQACAVIESQLDSSREVLTGTAEPDLRWAIVAGGTNEWFMTILDVWRGDVEVGGAGMGGPRLREGSVLRAYAGKHSGLPYFVIVRTAAEVDRVVATTEQGTDVVLTLSPVFLEFGLRFAAAALPVGESPGTIRAEVAGRVVETRLQKIGPRPRPSIDGWLSSSGDIE